MAATGNEVPLLSQLRTLKDWIVTQLGGKAPSSHTHTVSDITNLDPLSYMPIGTVIEVKQSAGTWNPAERFGGTWVLDEDTYLFAGIKRYWRTA